MRSVVVTRPLAQAADLARLIEQAGRTAHVFPLLEILPLQDDAGLRAALDNLRQFALVAFVSPNAIDAALRVLPSWPQGVPLAVVGEGSRKALAAHGIDDGNATIYRPRNPERTDSQTLLEVLDLPALRGKQVLIIRGESGREYLSDALRGAGVSVVQVAAYRRRAPDFDAARRAELARLLAQECIWVVTSSEALRHLLTMAQACGQAFVAKMQQQRLLVSHQRIAESARMLGFTTITLCGSGDECLIAALQSLE